MRSVMALQCSSRLPECLTLWKHGSCFPSLSFFCIWTAECVWDAHGYARASRRRLIRGNADDLGTGTATDHMLSRIVLA